MDKTREAERFYHEMTTDYQRLQNEYRRALNEIERLHREIKFRENLLNAVINAFFKSGASAPNVLKENVFNPKAPNWEMIDNDAYITIHRGQIKDGFWGIEIDI